MKSVKNISKESHKDELHMEALKGILSGGEDSNLFLSFSETNRPENILERPIIFHHQEYWLSSACIGQWIFHKSLLEQISQWWSMVI